MKEKSKDQNKKVKKIFLDDLPRYKDGRYKGKINWMLCIGLLVRFIYDDIEGWIEIVGYDGKDLDIKYNKKESFKIKTDNFQGCKIGKLLGTYTGDFKVKVGTTFKDEKRDITIIDKKYEKDKKGQNWKYYKYKCNKCGWTEGFVREKDLLKGNSCACCCNPSQIVVEGINDIPTTDPWMVKYFQNPNDAKKYTKSSNQKIHPICPDCGRVKDKEICINNIYNKKSIGCSCGDGQSYPEKFTYSILEQLGIDFQIQLTKTIFKWCGDYRYDFYFELNEEKYIIETHGSQHYEQTGRKGAKTLEEEQENDRIKEQLAIENGIKEENYIVINCRESELDFIKDKILKSKLNVLFNLSNIDWLKCHEFALKNRVKEACELKKNNPDLTTGDIGKIMKLNKNTIANYLKKGTKLGWCEYNPKEEKYKSDIKSGDRSKKFIAKPIEMFKDDVSLGRFESAAELERQSERLFGIKLNRNNISSVLTNKRTHHKGYKFKHI